MQFKTPRKTFRGFNTIDADNSRDFALYDIELIKRDLMNHFHTRIGEMILRPTYGCRIFDYLMEPLTPFVRDEIVAEAIRVCQSDARVEVVGVDVYQLDSGLRVDITCNFVPYSVVDSFSVGFEERS